MSINVKKTKKYEKDSRTVFDVAKVYGGWLCREDQELCKMHIELQCLGYTASFLHLSLPFIGQKDVADAHNYLKVQLKKLIFSTRESSAASARKLQNFLR